MTMKVENKIKRYTDDILRLKTEIQVHNERLSNSIYKMDADVCRELIRGKEKQIRKIIKKLADCFDYRGAGRDCPSYNENFYKCLTN